MSPKNTFVRIGSGILLACTIATTGIVAWPHVAAAVGTAVPDGKCVRDVWVDGSCKPAVYADWGHKQLEIGGKKIDYSFRIPVEMSNHASEVLADGGGYFAVPVALIEARRTALESLENDGVDAQNRKILPGEVDGQLGDDYRRLFEEALAIQFVRKGMPYEVAMGSFSIGNPDVHRGEVRE